MKMKNELMFIFEPGSTILKAKYFEEEKSFGLLEQLETIALFLNHQYLSLEIDVFNNNVVGLSGYFDLSLCYEEELSMDITAEKHLVKAVFLEPLELGVGYTYPIEGRAVYDKDKKLLKIGESDNVTHYLKIGLSLIVGINRGIIKCLLIKNI